MNDLDSKSVVDVLNRILEQELAGVVRYTHYSLLVFGHARIPIVAWLREQASESLLHAQQAGEMITLLGAYPSLGIGTLLDSHQHDIAAIMRRQGARALQGVTCACPRAIGDAGGICSSNGLSRGNACRRGKQDAP